MGQRHKNYLASLISWSANFLEPAVINEHLRSQIFNTEQILMPVYNQQ